MRTNHVGPDALVWAGERSSPEPGVFPSRNAGQTAELRPPGGGEDTCPYVGRDGLVKFEVALPYIVRSRISRNHVGPDASSGRASEARQSRESSRARTRAKNLRSFAPPGR